MSKNDPDCVKIYFIDPIDKLSVIISTLIEIEYESYTINPDDKDILLKLLTQDEDIRNVIFLCINKKEEIIDCYEYIKKIKEIENCQVLCGAFIYDKMEIGERIQFLQENVAMIEFSDISKNTLQTMKKILTFFEAKSKKGYISSKTYDISDAFFYFPEFKDPVKGKIKNISAFAFSCEINKMYKTAFNINGIIKESLLVLNGTRVTSSLKTLGFSRDNPEIFMFKYCSTKIESNKLVSTDQVNPDVKRKVHNYIKWCLKEDIKAQLNKLKKK